MPLLIWVALVLGILAGPALPQGLETTATKDDWEEINFEFNSSILTDGYPSLLRLAELLQQNGGVRVVVTGHADSIGNTQANHRLGLARATTVRNFLTKYGARAEQVLGGRVGIADHVAAIEQHDCGREQLET